MVAVWGVLLGLLLGLLGLLGVRHPAGIARLEERIDAIGSSRDVRSVEPAGWRVALTKLLAACLASVVSSCSSRCWSEPAAPGPLPGGRYDRTSR